MNVKNQHAEVRMLPWKQDRYSYLWIYELITNKKHNSVWKAAIGNQYFNFHQVIPY